MLEGKILMNKLKHQAITLVFFICTGVYSQTCNGMSLDSLTNKYDKFEIIKILSPLLHISNIDTKDSLEDCLYLGEIIARETPIPKKIMIELNAIRNPKSYDEKYWERYYDCVDRILKAYAEIGIEIGFDKRSDQYIYRKHEFLERIVELNPESKYKPDYEYIIINENSDYRNWQKWIRQLERYLEKYHDNKYSVNAKIDLAQLYDDLWILKYPGSRYRETFDQRFMKQFEIDTILADEYRTKSIKLYRDYIQHIEELFETESIPFNQRILNYCKNRIEQLENRSRKSHSLKLFRGYD